MNNLYTGSWSNSNQIQIWDVRKLTLNLEVQDIESTYIYSLKLISPKNCINDSNQKENDKYILYCGSNRNVVGLYEINNFINNNEVNITKEYNIDKGIILEENKINNIAFETKYADKPCLSADFNIEENILSSAWGEGIIRNYKLNIL